MATLAKVCVRCKQDCSTRPRIRDGSGRYVCKQCLKPDETTKVEREAAGLPADDFPQDWAQGLPDVPAEPIQVAPALNLCPTCQSSIPYGVSLCVQCGYDVKKGKQLTTTTGVEEPDFKGKPATDKCITCGYRLKGLDTIKCPECGTLSVRENVERERRRKESRETVKWAYLTPLIHFAIGFGIILAVYSSQGIMDELPGLMISLGVTVVIGAAGFFLCSLMWLGFDAPMHLIAIRFAGVYSVCSAISVVLAAIGIPFMPFIVGMAIYVMLLASAFDLDIQDAVLVGIVTWFIMFMTRVAIVLYLLEQ